MTPALMRLLKQGEEVCWTGTPYMTGTVQSVRGNAVRVRWEDGITEKYLPTDGGTRLVERIGGPMRKFA